MPGKCFPIRLDDGTAAIVCGSFPAEKHCVVCGTFAARLCDFKMPSGKTCDALMCDEHSVHIGGNRDFCSLHKPKETQPALFGGPEPSVKSVPFVDSSAPSAVKGSKP